MWLHKPRHDLQLSYKRSTTQTNELKMRLIGVSFPRQQSFNSGPEPGRSKVFAPNRHCPEEPDAHHGNIRQFNPIKEYRPRPRMTTLYIMRTFYEMKFYHKIILSDYFS